MENIIIATAIINLPFYIRFARAEVNVRRNAGWVEAARACGDGHLSVVLRFLLPNVLPAMAVQISLNLGWAILNAAGLSFIGLGVQAPTPEWGIMVAEGAALHHHRQMVAGGVPRPGADADRAVLQPAGRRAARHPRPADAHMTAPLLQVEDLRVSFSTPQRHASMRCTASASRCEPGQTLGHRRRERVRQVRHLAGGHAAAGPRRADRRRARAVPGPRHHPRRRTASCAACAAPRCR